MSPGSQECGGSPRGGKPAPLGSAHRALCERQRVALLQSPHLTLSSDSHAPKCSGRTTKGQGSSPAALWTTWNVQLQVSCPLVFAKVFLVFKPSKGVCVLTTFAISLLHLKHKLSGRIKHSEAPSILPQLCFGLRLCRAPGQSPEFGDAGGLGEQPGTIHGWPLCDSRLESQQKALTYFPKTLRE